MTRTELLAILRGAGPPDGHDGCRVIRTPDHAAVLRTAPLLPPKGRTAALKAAAEQARLLEGLMPFGTVLPALSGQRIREPEVPRLVAANLPMLARLEARLSGRVQYQVTVRWQAEHASAHFGRPPSGHATDIASLACELRERIGAHLDFPGAETLALPVAGDMIANHAVLVETSSESDLDAAAERIDAIWSEGFTVRMIGPYPAVSFASLVFDRVDAAAIRSARAAFALPAGFSADALRVARRGALLGAAPEARERLRWQAEVLACAERLGDDTGPLHLARLWSEGMSESIGEARAA